MQVYSAALGRIREQGEERARSGTATPALMWISHSEWSLKAGELCHALSVKIGSPNLNAENILSISILLDCCQGLVVDKQRRLARPG